MPNFLTRVFIVLFWLATTVILIQRDVLPRYTLGTPPDWKQIIKKSNETTTRWQIAVEEADGRTRAVGQATNLARKGPDGGMTLESHVKMDARGLFQGTPFQLAEATHFEFNNRTLISPQGLLDQIRADVRVQELGDKPVLNIQAVPDNHGKLEVRFNSPISPLLNFQQNIPFAPQGLVRGGMEPIDQLPGLRVGQRWTTQILQPMTARPDAVVSEVVSTVRIFWNGNPVEVFLVEHKASTFSARSWVRPDGLVLRQQLPTPLVRLVLEREGEGELR